MRDSKRGEIITAILLGAFVVATVGSIVASFFAGKNATATKSHAAGSTCTKYPSIGAPDTAPPGYYWEADCDSSMYLKPEIKAARNYCVSSSECIQNTGRPDSGFVSASTSNFCYTGFGGVTDQRCMMLRYASACPQGSNNCDPSPTPNAQYHICPVVGQACSEVYDTTDAQGNAITCHKFGTCNSVGEGPSCSWGTSPQGIHSCCGPRGTDCTQPPTATPTPTHPPAPTATPTTRPVGVTIPAPTATPFPTAAQGNGNNGGSTGGTTGGITGGQSGNGTPTTGPSSVCSNTNCAACTSCGACITSDKPNCVWYGNQATTQGYCSSLPAGVTKANVDVNGGKLCSNLITHYWSCNANTKDDNLNNQCHVSNCDYSHIGYFVANNLCYYCSNPNGSPPSLVTTRSAANCITGSASTSGNGPGGSTVGSTGGQTGVQTGGGSALDNQIKNDTAACKNTSCPVANTGCAVVNGKPKCVPNACKLTNNNQMTNTFIMPPRSFCDPSNNGNKFDCGYFLNSSDLNGWKGFFATDCAKPGNNGGSSSGQGSTTCPGGNGNTCPAPQAGTNSDTLHVNATFTAKTVNCSNQTYRIDDIFVFGAVTLNEGDTVLGNNEFSDGKGQGWTTGNHAPEFTYSKSLAFTLNKDLAVPGRVGLDMTLHYFNANLNPSFADVDLTNITRYTWDELKANPTMNVSITYNCQ